MKPRRHCMVVDNTWPDFRVEREARALMTAGYEVDVICAAESGERRFQMEDGLAIHRLPLRRMRGAGLRSQLIEYLGFLAAAFVQLLRLHRHRRYRSVQVHNVPDFLVFAALGPRLAGARVILDLHDLMPEFMASRRGVALSHPIVRLIKVEERLACAFAQRVITVTETWRDVLIERGVPRDKTAVVMNLPDPGLIPPLAPDAPRSEPDGPVTLIYHGTLTNRYGIDTTLRAFARARNAVRDEIDLRLIIHGRGEALDDLRRLATELSVTDVVEFSTKFMPTAELPRLLSRAHIAVITYRRDVFTDGILPTKLLEYAALGIPTIVGRTPATVDAFDASSVRFVDGQDEQDVALAIQDLAGDVALRAALSRNARDAASKRTWEGEAARYVRLVDELTARDHDR